MTAELQEATLARHLQPIRGLALAHAIYASFQVGLFDALARGATSVEDLAALLDLNGYRLRGLIDYLENENLVERMSNSVTLTELGTELLAARPWYDLLVGGYAGTFGQLPVVLKEHAGYASRDGASVAVGSCGISQHDALPMVLELLSQAAAPSAIVDLGCGDGTFLADIAVRYPDVPCIGVEPDDSARLAADAEAHRRNLDNFRVIAGDALHFDVPEGTQQAGTCFITAFVLQEILEQSGEDAVVDLLRQTFAKDPFATWIAIEVDRRHPLDAASSDLVLGYYNPYYLLHRITEQRLLSAVEWRRIFETAGLEVIAEVFPAPNYDPLRLKFGNLLRLRRSH